MRTLFIPLFLLVWWLPGCQPEVTIPKTTAPGPGTGSAVFNSGLTLSPANWRFGVGDAGSQGNPNDYQSVLVVASSSSPLTPSSGAIGLGGFGSPAYTLSMSASTIQDTASYCYWVYSFSPPTGLRVGQSVTLKARVRLEKVLGRGISLVLRGDRRTQPTVLFATTEGKLPLTGTADYRDYSVTLPYTTPVDDLLAYFVLLTNTTGSTTVSDVSVTLN